MFDKLTGKAKAAGLMNAVYSKHFPEGTITYCANHCAKNLHKDLFKIKPSKCQVSQGFLACC